MKKGTPIFSRCIAMMLAVMLAFANVPGIMVTAFAAEMAVSAGSVIAENYELSEAEKALLRSGYLAYDSVIEYDPAEESWVTVDHDSRKITARGEKGWVAVKADVLVDEAVIETVELAANESNTVFEGGFNFDGKAFSVRVHYELSEEIENQAEMLAAAEHLKQGIANAEAVEAQGGNLYILEQAMSELVKFANEGIKTPFGTAKFNAEVTAAVNALNDQITANGGRFTLSIMAEAYGQGSGTSYIVNSGRDMQAETVFIHGKVSTINVALTMMVKNLAIFVENGWVSKDIADRLQVLGGVCADIENGLASPAGDAWYAANNPGQVVKGNLGNGDYENLDGLVAALNELTAVEIRNELVISHAHVDVNMNMKNVTVTVALKVVEDKTDSAKLIDAGSRTVTVTLADGTKKAEIEAAVEASGVIAGAKTEWAGKYVDGHFDIISSGLPETLTDDITYTITYSPKIYTVELGYAENLNVPYGYRYTLPVHTNEEKAYDYTVDGTKKAQGDVIFVSGNTVITRREGKAYTSYDLYSVIADNYGNDIAQAILGSGALKNDEAVNVRKPDNSAMSLKDDILKADDYNAAYNGLYWKAYTYGENGTENYFAGSEAFWEGKVAKVKYKLTLTNYSVEEVRAILELAETLKEEAGAQKETLDRMAGYHKAMGQLDKMKLGALSGIIEQQDFTPEDNDPKDAKNLELIAYFKEQIGGIINENFNGKNLKIYDMLSLYLDENSGGLKYYYSNSAAVISEISSLSNRLSALLADDEKTAALEFVVATAGFPEYADRIKDLEAVMSEVNDTLTPPNEEIDLTSPNLGKLTEALEAEGKVEYQKLSEKDHAYIISDVLTVQDSSIRMVQVEIIVNDKSATVGITELEPGTVLTKKQVEKLQNDFDEALFGLLGDNTVFYECAVEGMEISDLVGVSVEEDIYSTYTYTAKEYIVKISGEADQIITVENSEIRLPKHPKTGYSYRYTIDGVADIVSDTYVFSPEQIVRLFADGTYTVSRVEINDAEDKIENSVFDKWLVKDENGEIIGIRAEVDGGKDGIMSFAIDMVDSGFTYVAFNGEAFVYMENGTLEISLQTFINALLSDSGFSSGKLIDLCSSGEGEFVHTKIDLGDSANDLEFEGLDFSIYFNSVPSQFATIAKGLEAIEEYISFEAGSGAMNFEINLPEKVYEAYLAALMVSGDVDKYTMDEINSEIALQFIWDYIDIIRTSDADTETFTNTLAKLGIEKDLTGTEDYYQLVKKLLSNEGIVINPEDDNDLFDLTVTAKSKEAIDDLIGAFGIDVSDYQTYLGMVKEYKDPDAELSVAVTAELLNTEKEYEAVVINNKASVINKFDFIENLAAEAGNAGEAMIILLDDVKGNLVFSGATILDLNGFTVTGDIRANDEVLIFDSGLDTYGCGGVTGKLEGDFTITGGNYEDDVAGYLPEGYELEGKTVRNVLYTVSDGEAQASNFFSYAKSVGGEKAVFDIEADIFDNNITDYVETAAEIAADIAIDIVLEHFISASLTAGGHMIYEATVSDIIGLYNGISSGKAVLSGMKIEGLNGLVNEITDKMMDFAAVEDAIGGEELVSFDMAAAPWKVTVSHIEDGDYLDFDAVPNAEKEKIFTVGVRIEDDKAGNAAKHAGGLSDIIVADETDAEVVFTSRSGESSLVVAVDVTEDQNAGNAIKCTNEEYLAVLAVVLGYELDNEAIVEAIGDKAALKAEFDKLTAAEIVAAFEALDTENSFEKICKEVGAKASEFGDAGKLESVYRLIAVSAGNVLNGFDIENASTAMGEVFNETTGYYVLSGSRSAGGDSVTVTEFTVKARLFGEDKPVHKHDYAEKVTKEPTCTETGVKEYTCECGDYYTEIVPALGHTAGEPVTENEKAATCTEDGVYDSVIYCTVCGEEISRETVTVPAAGHTKGDSVVENKVEATCGVEGSYDLVVYCAVCGEEISRERISIPATGKHIRSEAVVENNVPATCTADGSYDLVVYCSVCEAELSRETVTVPSLGGHTESEPIVENNVPATCVDDGSYDLVIYCSVCGKELGRETVTVPATGKHTEGEAVVENEVPATCVTDGSHDLVVYCTVCGKELSRENVIVPANGEHTRGEAVVENEVPVTCTTDGSYDVVIYCSVCGVELTRGTVTIPATGHNFKETGRKEATCCEEGWILWQCGCGETKTEAIPVEPFAHDYKIVEENKATCEEPGDATYECANGCGSKFTVKTEDAFGHKAGTAVKEKEDPATCTEDGYYEEVVCCTVCGKELSRTAVEVNAFGHNWSKWEEIRPATRNKTGLMRRFCANCGDEQDRIIPKLASAAEKGEEENPITGAPLVSILAAAAVLAGAGYIAVKRRKH